MTTPLEPYQHPSTGFTVPLPGDWERTEDYQGIALIAIEPERGPWFRANAVVTVEPVPPERDLDRWQGHAGDVLARTLTGFMLIDLEHVDLAGRSAIRRLAHHETEAGAVTMEQWALVEQATGYTLTTSVGTLEYADRADLFAAMAREFRPDPGFAA